MPQSRIPRPGTSARGFAIDLRLPDLEHAKAAGSDFSSGPDAWGKMRYGMRMMVRIWNDELLTRM